LAGHELQASAWRLVIEQDSRAGEQVIALTVIDCQEMSVNFRYPIRTAWIERRMFTLGSFADFAEHFAAAGLVKFRLGTDLAQSVQNACNAYSGEFGGEHRFLP